MAFALWNPVSDWRMGDDMTFKADYGDRFSVDMSGWYVGAGIVVQF